MSILLSDEEIDRAIENEGGGGVFSDVLGVSIGLTHYTCCRATNKAQLKKVMGEIKSNAYVALDKRTGEVELGSVIISPEFWEKLLKEIE